MINLDIKINKVVDVIYNKEIYKAIIQDIKEGEILITIPVRDGSYLTLNKGEEIEQFYYEEKGNVFLYKSRVIDRHKERNISFYRISKPYDIKRIQRRNYVRISIFQAINYIKENTDIRKNVNRKFKEAFLLDLSGGGMKIKLEEELSVNDKIRASLNLDGEEFNIKGKVIRVDKTNDKKYICGINFEDIDSPTREKIIRIIFKIMRKEISMIYGRNNYGS